MLTLPHNQNTLRRLGLWLPTLAPGFAGNFPCCCGAGPGSTTSSVPPGSTTPISTGPCPVCEGGIISLYYRVDLSGIATATGLCTGSRTCPDLNGSYVFGPMEVVVVTGGSICTHGIEIDGVCRTDDSCFSLARLTFQKPDIGPFAGEYIVLVELSSTNMCDEDVGEPVMSFVHSFGTEAAPHCINDFPIEISGGDVEFIITPKCSASGATCTITPIPAP